MKRLILGCWLVCCLGLVTGCGSISKGITQAILEQEDEDERRCWITGRKFVGLDSLFQKSESTASDTPGPARLKVMKVHGIGSHAPGYSRRLLDGLVHHFGFNKMAETVKTIHMTQPGIAEDLGVLTVFRYMNEDLSRELLYYEVTWEPIIEEQKQLVAYDSTLESSARRVPFNHTMKTFVNGTVPDALIYNTRYRTPIQRSVGQTACWMLTEEWQDLPSNARRHCDVNRADLWSRVGDSNLAIISHSLGSRISLDSLQDAAFRISGNAAYRKVGEELKQKPVYLYMLSNQLPLLQIGQPLPEVSDQIGAYCSENGEHYDGRVFKKLQIVAFTDPNDLFSYSIKPDFVNRYVDSRLCPAVSNVTIEVAHITSLFGSQAFASAQKAHSEYEVDSRVLKMLVSGVAGPAGDNEIAERCEFIEAIPD